MEQPCRLIGQRQKIDTNTLRNLSRKDRLRMLYATCFGTKARPDARSVARMRQRIRQPKP